jgi:hypothetical protein
MRMLWFMPMLFGPKSSAVTDTAAAKMNPELRPIRAVPATRVFSPSEFHNRKKAIGIGANAAASQPVRANDTFLHADFIHSTVSQDAISTRSKILVCI